MKSRRPRRERKNEKKVREWRWREREMEWNEGIERRMTEEEER